MLALIDDTKLCSRCDQVKTLEEFHKDKRGKFGVTYYCKKCANQNSRFHHKRRMKEEVGYKESKRASYIKFAHGISIHAYEERVAQQNYSCAICGVQLSTSGYKTHLDHNHKTGELRAILCTNCNRGLGHFQDNPELLKKAAEYLDTHNKSVDLVKEVCHQ